MKAGNTGLNGVSENVEHLQSDTKKQKPVGAK